MKRTERKTMTLSRNRVGIISSNRLMTYALMAHTSRCFSGHDSTVVAARAASCKASYVGSVTPVRFAPYFDE